MSVLPPGRRLGPCEVLPRIGAGGMGEVLKAKDTRLQRTVAVKVLPSELASDTERRGRFEREAHNAYLKGFFHGQSVTPEAFDTAERHFNLAREKDPSYAPAYAGAFQSLEWLRGDGLHAAP